MNVHRRFGLFAVACVLAVSSLAVHAPRAQGDTVPGVTSNEILLGGTHPFSGPASAYGAIGKGIDAYFAYVNAKGGVYGRKIVYKDVDDAYNPPQTVQLTKQLVEQDHVLAMFNTLGTPPNLAIRPYLNEQHVPQLFLATGATTWATDAAKYPWTLGFNPDYQAEAEIFAKNILAHNPGAKIAVLYQNDDFGQDYVTGLQKGLGAKAGQIVKTASYEVTDPDVRSQMEALKASGADTLVIAATPKFAVQSLVARGQLGWKATTYLTDVSASQQIMHAATGAGGNGATDGVITAEYTLDPTNPSLADTPGMKLYREIVSKYAPGVDPSNAFVLYGVAVAYTMTDALEKAGKSLTRESLMQAALHLNEKNPFFFPGIELRTSPSDRFPIRSEQLARYEGGLFVPIGPVIDARK
ncbi:MAG TPA: ABC transporter substrate-binding protein [Candidatus Aquilonibacter sp.]